MAILFALCLWTILQVLNAGNLEGSAGASPSLIFRPKPREGQGSMIWYQADNPASYQHLINDLTDFLKPYRHDAEVYRNLMACDFKTPPPPASDLVCDVDMRTLGPCSAENGFGYNKSMPCVFLKLDNINGWTPDFYNSSDNLPSEMPVDLRAHIKSVAYDKDYLKMVWISCEGELPVDQENIGPVMYLPTRGFPGYYFPYTGQEDYRSPLVALWLERPAKGLLIRIKCRAWAHNIEYDQTKGLGSTLFEIMVE